MGSPLDLDFEIVWKIDAAQLEVYSRAVLITMESYLQDGSLSNEFYFLQTALENIQNSCNDVYKLNEMPLDFLSAEPYKKLWVAMRFVREAIEKIEKQPNISGVCLRKKKEERFNDFYDCLANLIFEIIFFTTSITAPPDKCWSIHHNAIWGPVFNFGGKSKARQCAQFKLRRLLYEEIIRLEEMPNYKSARILGYCLNVMGLELRKESGFEKESFPLHKVVLEWTKRNYMRLSSVQPDVAKSCILGSVSLDEENTQLVFTYRKGLSLEAPKRYLKLDN